MTVLLLLLAQTASDLSDLDPRVLPKEVEAEALPWRDARARLQEANDRASAAWRAIRTREDWEAYCRPRLEALRGPAGPRGDLNVRVTGTFDGDGIRIENVVFESRPGLLVTANLYSPSPPRPSMPGILICHSHHNPKTQGELQDMGTMWARAGCLVLVMDQLGHGERRQHPFVDPERYPKPFRVSRQDYYFRYNVALHLSLAGESLIGWMAHDLSRGVDLLLGRTGIDADRIILMGAVAGGGDPAAVTAALDRRIACAVPFNFGGPQPETKYPLPDDAETWFNYAGSGSWESTRNLAGSARDGFLPWVIVGSIAPRRLVYGHEFSWDRERDPVWKRLGKIWGFYDAPDRLAFATGRGVLKGRPPEASHCNNIGPVQRERIHGALKVWFGIQASEKDRGERRSAADLACVKGDVRLHPARELVTPPPARPWAELLGGVEAASFHRVVTRGRSELGSVVVERVELSATVPVPLLLLRPSKEKAPVVVGVAWEGKAGFLNHRADAIARLLRDGVAVCLPDVRDTGETRPGSGLNRRSGLTSVSSTELMLGRTLSGLRVRDLRGVLAWLRGRKDLDGVRIALWGESFGTVNAPDRRVEVPWGADEPEVARPQGSMAALLTALFDPGVRGVWARGGLVSPASLLESPFVWVPHDTVVPGMLGAKAEPRCAVRRVDEVDGRNRRVGESLEDPGADAAAWLLKALRDE